MDKFSFKVSVDSFEFNVNVGVKKLSPLPLFLDEKLVAPTILPISAKFDELVFLAVVDSNRSSSSSLIDGSRGACDTTVF